MDRHELFQLEFFEFCMNGDLNEVKSLLRGGRVEPNFQHRMNGWSALHWAARREHIDVCIELISAGFNIDLTDKKGQTPFDVCPSHNSNLKELLRPEDCSEMPAMPTPNQEASEGFTPGYLTNPVFPYVKKQVSVDKEPASPTRSGYYSYGRRDSASRTRFVLVLTSSADGKEAYKRITVPGGSTLSQLKKSVEAAMRKGQVSDLLILPDRILLEDDEQIGSLADCQKLAVVFDETAPAVPLPLHKTSVVPGVLNSGTDISEHEETNGSFEFVKPPQDSGDVAHTVCSENEMGNTPQVEAVVKTAHNTIEPRNELSSKTTSDSDTDLSKDRSGVDNIIEDSSNAVKEEDPVGWVQWITASPIRCAATVSTVAASGGLLYALIKKRTL